MDLDQLTRIYIESTQAMSKYMDTESLADKDTVIHSEACNALLRQAIKAKMEQSQPVIPTALDVGDTANKAVPTIPRPKRTVVSFLRILAGTFE